MEEKSLRPTTVVRWNVFIETLKRVDLNWDSKFLIRQKYHVGRVLISFFSELYVCPLTSQRSNVRIYRVI